MQATRARSHATKASYTKMRLEVTAGPDAGETLVATGERSVRVGTGTQNDLVLSDRTVSRRHCEVEVTVNGFRVRDADSTNGVMDGGVRVYDAAFAEAVSLTLGDTTLRLTPLPDESVERQLASARQFGDFRGGADCVRTMFSDLERIAAADVSLLIEGETGTGKELIAEGVHRASARAARPYVVVDCAALHTNLAESILFGHAKGAFPGALEHQGLFVEADGGSVFIDELGELPTELQPKLLRVLQTGEVRPLGSRKVHRVDVRVISATNRNLRAEVRRKNFREDLYFRVATTRVQVPPLRDRMGDLPLLVGHFLANSRPPRQLSDLPSSIWEELKRSRWPGNVRQLRKALESFVVLPDRPLDLASFHHTAEQPPPIARSEDGPGEGSGESPSSSDEPLPPLRVARREWNEREELGYLRRLLQFTRGDVSRAARVSEVSRQMIQKLMRKHDVQREDLADPTDHAGA